MGFLPSTCSKYNKSMLIFKQKSVAEPDCEQEMEAG